MKRTLTFLLLIASFCCHGQNRSITWGHSFFVDSAMERYFASYADTSVIVGSRNTEKTIDKDGRTQEWIYGGKYIVRNYKLVPSGFYCDTTITPIRGRNNDFFVGFDVFMDRTLLVHTEFPASKNNWWITFCDSNAIKSLHK